MHSPDAITELIHDAAAGDHRAVDELFQVVYGELRGLAQAQRRRWHGDYTLNTTALVHDAYLKLVGQEQQSWQDRAHFYAVASKAMRHILVNYAERRRAQKRGGDAVMMSLDEANPVAPEAADEILALNDALERLATMNERQSRVVECRFFGGLTVPETADALGTSAATVKRDWAIASAWLKQQIGGR
jgi:RNA polymerase sigma factor (TIGR02999 family)